MADWSGPESATIYSRMKCISIKENYTVMIVIGQLRRPWQEIQLDIAE